MAPETTPPINNNINTNNNTNNVNVQVNIEHPINDKEKKESIFKLYSREIIIGIIVTLASAFIAANTNGLFDNKKITTEVTKETKNKKIVAILKAYSDGINKKSFDAYKYFTPKVERFYQMFDISPKKINDYVNGLFYQQFQNPTMWFDENTLSVKEIHNGGFEASVIMYSTYFKVKEKKQYSNYRTRMELRLDNNYHIKYFRQFLD